MSLPEDLQKELSHIIVSLKSHVESQQLSGIQHFYSRPAEVSVARPGGSEKPELLLNLRAELGDCRRCALCNGRKNIVFGEGDPDAGLMFIGDGPDADDDAQGRPCAGKAGQLLTRIIKAIQLERSQVYISNILKCRPSENRDPEGAETQTCLPFLKKQIEIIAPRIICALGTFAAQALLGTDREMPELRGRFHALGDMLVMPTYHPAYLLSHEEKKKETWKDMQMVQQEYVKGL
ncbi:MAG: uracil-DNA glycosylase [Pseudomonadota bacterium]